MKRINITLILLITIFTVSGQSKNSTMQEQEVNQENINTMTKNELLIQKFYTGFSNGSAEEMNSCYHKDVVFKDPAFGELKGQRAFNMWEMLMSKKDKNMQFSFNNIQVVEEGVTAEWTAIYPFGEKKREVVNNVNASFKFKDGKIIEHTDSFNIWKWSKQALGTSGYLLGWTPFMKKKIQETANGNLDAFLSEQQ